jgi:hypothetical protein
MMECLTFPLNKGAAPRARGLSWSVRESRADNPRRCATAVAARRPLC